MVTGIYLAVKQIGQTIQWTTHSTKHSECQAIRDCLEDEVYQVWRSKDKMTEYRIAKLPDGKFGIQVCRGKCEVTAFSPGDGSFNTVRSYLERLGAHRFLGK
jgi:hypothetical protein